MNQDEKVLGDDNDSNDWYEQMANQAFSENDDGWDLKQEINVPQNTDDFENEALYFDRMQETNAALSEELFKHENDFIWQSTLRSIYRPQFSGPCASAASAICSPLNTKDQCLLTEISLNGPVYNDSALLLLQQWLFSFLPKSSKVYHLLTSFLNRTNYWLPSPALMQHYLFADNIIDPSFVAIIRWKVTSTEPFVEAMIFHSLSLSHLDNRKVVHSLLQELLGIIIEKYYRSHLHTERRYFLQFSGIDSEFFEQIIAPATSYKRHSKGISMKYKIEQDWTEFCDVYVLSTFPSPAVWELTEEEKTMMIGSNLELSPIRYVRRRFQLFDFIS